ncbi:MAG: AEC family transporter [Pseudomonadota bacterium]
MAIFSIVFFKIISVLLSVIIGFLAGRWSKVERDSIASLLFYFISPIVFFSIPCSTTLSLSSLSITLVTFVIATGLCSFSYYIFGKYWDDDTRNILAMSAGTGNGGYFMLPIAAALFDDYTLSIYMMATIGVNLYESSVGYYICAKSMTSTKESIIKVLKLPMLKAFALGCFCSVAGLTIPEFLDDFTYSMRSTFSILGMIMIGLGLSTIPKFEVDKRFTIAAFVSKFLFYPVAINIFILLDRYFLNFYDDHYYDALQLLAVAPMAANTIVIASIWKFNPEKVATTVLLSLLFALFYIPIVASLFIRDVGM